MSGRLFPSSARLASHYILHIMDCVKELFVRGIPLFLAFRTSISAPAADQRRSAAEGFSRGSPTSAQLGSMKGTTLSASKLHTLSLKYPLNTVNDHTGAKIGRIGPKGTRTEHTLLVA